MQFENAAVEFVRSRTSQYLYLPGAAPKLCIGRRCDHAYFRNRIHARKKDGIHAQIDRLVHDVDAVSCDIQRTDARSGEIVSKQAALGENQAQRVAVREREVLDPLIVDHSSDGCRCCSERRIQNELHFDLAAHSGQLELKVQIQLC